ncbi:MAG: signal peptidase II [Alphaproteobacteria bacterium]|nr:signal peptidase II [Alphaproteobacteria bacterium]
MATKRVWFWPVLLGTLALDQATKMWVFLNLRERVDQIDVIPHWLGIIHAQNPAAAFGFLDGFAGRYVVFAVFTVLAVGMLFEMYRRLPRTDTLTASALALVLGGVVGNAIDRVHKRTVTDFVRFYTDDPATKAWLREHVGMTEWPAFNVADSTLLVGVIALLLLTLFREEDDALADDGTGPGRGPDATA